MARLGGYEAVDAGAGPYRFKKIEFVLKEGFLVIQTALANLVQLVASSHGELEFVGR